MKKSVGVLTIMSDYMRWYKPAGGAGVVLLGSKRTADERGVFNHHLERGGRRFGLLTIVDRPGHPLFTSEHGPPPYVSILVIADLCANFARGSCLLSDKLI